MFSIHLIRYTRSLRKPARAITCQQRSVINISQTKFVKSSSTDTPNCRTRLVCLKGFQTSPPRKVPPDVWAIIRVFLRSLAMISGRAWGLSPKFRRGPVAAGGATVIVFGGLFYVTHLEECPITKRKKFLIFSEKAMMQMAERESEKVQKWFEGKVTRSGRVHTKLMQISLNIVTANLHLPGVRRDWSVFVIEDPKIVNAFVLPNGHIFIFSGMILEADNESQMATVIGHEIAHTLLHHRREMISRAHFMELMLLLPVLLIWMMLPDVAAVLSHVLTEVIARIVFKLPMSRLVEAEADELGLRMMARACYDPRESVELCRRMAERPERRPPEWLDTHPSFQTRQDTMNKLIPEVMRIYTKNC